MKPSISEPAMVPPGTVDRLLPPSWRRPLLVGVKAVHSLIYFSIEFCVSYLIYTGLKGREDKRTAIAAGVVAAESLIFVGNRCRCPLTGLAKNLGASSGSVTDIYLPSFLASNLVPIHVPLLALAMGLHARNFLRHPREFVAVVTFVLLVLFVRGSIYAASSARSQAHNDIVLNMGRNHKIVTAS
jgi:hypothetical protein